MTTNTKFFKLIKISPVGFYDNWDNTYCSFCRGLLEKPCHQCMHIDNKVCYYDCYNGVRLHKHCHDYMQKPLNNIYKNDYMI